MTESWTVKKFPLQGEADGCMAVYPLRGDRIIVRPVGYEHLAAICAAANDLKVASSTANLPHPYTEDDGKAFITCARQVESQNAGVRLVIERRSDGEFLGVIGLDRSADTPLSAEIGYWIAQAHWGQGIASDAVRLVAAHAFDDLGFQHLVASYAEDNPASGRVLEKSGFEPVGRLQVPFVNRPGGMADCVSVEVFKTGFDKVRQSRLLLVTAVALLDSDNRVLLQQRPEGKHLAGLWEFPGGKVDPGETPERALVRELQEELGIDVRQSCLAPLTFASYAYTDFHLLMPLYICRNWRGRVQGREGQAMAWVRGSQLDQYPMPPADIPLIPMLRDWL